MTVCSVALTLAVAHMCAYNLHDIVCTLTSSSSLRG